MGSEWSELVIPRSVVDDDSVGLAEVVAGLSAEVARLIEVVAQRDARIAEQDARIVELEKLLADSRRSGKRQAAPFSKGDPEEEPARPGRKSGQAHGRHGHRAVPGRVERTLEAPLPGCCPGCGGDVVLERVADQYQSDIAEQPQVTVTRFRVQVGRCTGCGKRVQGRHAEQTSDALGAAGSHIGPVAKSWAVWLHYQLGLSFAKTAELLTQLGMTVTRGALATAAGSTGKDLVPVRQDIVAWLNDSDVVVMDETGWRVTGESAWLWVATSPEGVTAYNVADGRGFDQACELINKHYNGVVVRDGWAPYRSYTAATHQSCVAHLLRRCHELSADLPAWAKGTPRQITDILQRGLAVRDHADCDPGDCAHATINPSDVAADLGELVELVADQAHPHDENRKLVKHLTNETDALFTFLTHPGVDATNWRAEQAIRPAVVNRKVWGGNRTWAGAKTQSVIMSVLRTTTQQGINPINYLVAHARAPNPNTVPLLPVT